MSMFVWSKSGCGNRAGHPVRRSCTFFVPMLRCQAPVLECQALKARTFEVQGSRFEVGKLLFWLWEVVSLNLQPRTLNRVGARE